MTRCLADDGAPGVPTFWGRNKRFCQFWSDDDGTHIYVYSGVGFLIQHLSTKDLHKAHDFIITHVGAELTRRS